MNIEDKAGYPCLGGLVLSGGMSTRMGQDKGAIKIAEFGGVDLRSRAYYVLKQVCSRTFVSCRPEQGNLIAPGLPQVHDLHSGIGPASGLLAAKVKSPGWAWLVLACDMPAVTIELLHLLIQERDPAQLGTCFVDHSNKIQPAFAIWEPKGLDVLNQQIKKGKTALSEVFQMGGCKQVRIEEADSLMNLNTPEDLRKFSRLL